jgi:hypothetical protein
MKARGKREAKRSASPLVQHKKRGKACRAEIILRPVRAASCLFDISRGDVPTSRDLPLAFIFRAFGALRSASMRLEKEQPYDTHKPESKKHLSYLCLLVYLRWLARKTMNRRGAWSSWPKR